MDSSESSQQKASEATLNLARVLREHEERVRAKRLAGLHSPPALTTEEMLKMLNEGLPPEMHFRLIKAGRPGPITMTLKSKRG